MYGLHILKDGNYLENLRITLCSNSSILRLALFELQYLHFGKLLRNKFCISVKFSVDYYHFGKFWDSTETSLLKRYGSLLSIIVEITSDGYLILKEKVDQTEAALKTGIFTRGAGFW